MLKAVKRQAFRAENGRFAIIASRYNAKYVDAMLRAAKDDVRRATTNSREWSLAASAGRARGAGGGLYWLPMD